MNTIGSLIALGYGAFFVFCIFALVYLVVRRIRVKKTESFEDRGN